MQNEKAELLFSLLEEAPEGVVVETGCIREEKEVIEDSKNDLKVLVGIIH